MLRSILISIAAIILLTVILAAVDGRNRTPLPLTYGADGPRADAITPIVSGAVDGHRVPALVIGIYDQGRREVYGFGNLGDEVAHTLAPDGDTLFEIGSITKVFTGLLLASAVVRNEVLLDAPISTLLPAEVHAPGRGDAAITLAHLATHTSGLPRLPTNMRPADVTNPYVDYGVEQLHAFLNKHELRRDPGQEYEYSNLGAGLLGYLLGETAARRPAQEGAPSPTSGVAALEALLRERITAPLGMDDTAFTLNEAQRSRLASPHARGRTSSNWDMNALAGAGGIRSSVNDMLDFIAGYIESDAATEGTADSPASDAALLAAAMRLAAEPRCDAHGSHRMGLGWHLKPEKRVAPASAAPPTEASAAATSSLADAGAHRDPASEEASVATPAPSATGPLYALWHNGATGGYASMLIINLETRRGIIVLANGAEPGMVEAACGGVYATMQHATP